MPDRWDAEANEKFDWLDEPVERAEVADYRTPILEDAAALARRAFREGLGHARVIALDAAGDYPEDIFRPIELGELAATGGLSDRIGAHMARITARNIAAAIRREIEGA